MVRHFSEYRRYFIGCTASGKPDIVDKNFVLRQSRTIYPYTVNYIERSIKSQSVLQPLDEEQLAAFEELGNSFREADYPLVDGARLVLDLLAEAGHKLVLLTQGGYDEQKYKVELHNLNEYFAEIIVVDKKTPAVYQNIMQRHAFAPSQTVVIGNSLKSEIAPALAVGAAAVLVRVCQGWDFENIELTQRVPVVHKLVELLPLFQIANLE